MLPAVYQFRARAQWRDVYSSWQSVTQRLSENLTVPTDLTFTPGDNPGISGLLSWSGNASIYRVTITANDDGAVPVLTQVTGDRYQVPVLKVGDYEASVVGLGRVEESGVATLTISIKAPDAPANVVFSALDGDSSSAGVVSWDAVPGSSGYQVRLCDDSHVIVTSKVTDNRWLIAPLTPGNYMVKVASISQREAAISEYSSVTFTLFGLSTPGGLTAEEVLTGSGIQIVSQVILTCDDVPGATRYEFEYQSVGHANWTGIQSGPAHTATVNAIAPGTYNVRVRAVNDIRQSGYATITFTIVGTLRPPSALTNLRLHAQAGTRASLSWDVSNDPDVLTGGSIHVRHTHIVGEGATWDSGTQVTDRLPGNATLSEVPLLSGTYLVKSVNASGFYSKTASAVVSNMAGAIGYNRVETRDEPNDWPGDKNKATVGPGGSLIMKETGNRFIDPDPPYYVLSEPLDLKAVVTARVTLEVDASVYIEDTIDDRADLIDDWPLFDGEIPDDVSLRYELSQTDDDPTGIDVQWSEWVPFIKGEFRGRAFRLRITLQGKAMGSAATLVGLKLIADVQGRIEKGVNIQATTAGYTVSYGTPFLTPASITITAHALPENGRWQLSGQSRSGFTIKFYKGNTPIAADFDYQAIGYGESQ
ncbi:fibronectin type III domain-containing protein [Candidatus Sororendozoicomonas aggregata]|uniref:fibronectin type III domain-containing protein n=1 Tax=Candidatus Sororendozoicomonas aggregata TaxID=3073239 RepID=UPI002ED3FBF1